MRGRKPVNLPLNLILQLHEKGYSAREIAWILEKDYNIRVSHITIWRRIRNFETKSEHIHAGKVGVNVQIDKVAVAKLEVEVYAGEAD